MDSQEIYKTIRETVLANLPESRVLLFGSRARGDGDRFSDYDLLVITPQTFPPREKIKLSTLLNHAIFKALEIPVDLSINSEEEVREKQDLPGHVVRTAIREGVILTPALKAYVESWLEKAEHDLLSAQRLLEIEPMILDNACFHCQQAVEICLKAYLIYNSFDIQKTHDIIALLNQCSKFDTIFAAIDPMDTNAYAVTGRYPDNNLMPTKEEAEGYYQLALQIKSLTSERIIFS